MICQLELGLRFEDNLNSSGYAQLLGDIVVYLWEYFRKFSQHILVVIAKCGICNGSVMEYGFQYDWIPLYVFIMHIHMHIYKMSTLSHMLRKC